MRFEVSKEPNEPDFEVNDFRCVSIRWIIVVVVLVITVGFLVGSAIYGLWHDDFSGLAAVSDYAQFLLGMILGYYFRSS